MMHIGNEWDALLADEIHKDYYLKLRQFLISEYTTRRIYPPMEDIFNALLYSVRIPTTAPGRRTVCASQ